MKLFIEFTKPPGDVLCLLGAIRELDKTLPNMAITFNIGGPHGQLYPDLLANNPLVDEAITRDNCDKVVKPDYGQAIKTADANGRGHFTEALYQELASEFSDQCSDGIDIRPALYLTDEEKATRPVQERYWVIMAGGKHDFTAKWWTQSSWQEVVNKLKDATNGAIGIQVGAAGKEHFNYKLRGVQNMVGQTTLRELVLLIYHSEGVICGVTSGMHIAGAFDKPCVVVAGGREGPWWEKYDTHAFVHTVGKLPCCQKPCWRSHVDAGAAKANPASKGGVCLSTSKNADKQGLAVVPKCMRMITPNVVLNAVRGLYVDKTDAVAPAPVKVASRTQLVSDVTIMVCLYGTNEVAQTQHGEDDGPLSFHELHKRCIDSILDTVSISEREKISFVIGCNEVDPATLKYLQHTLPDATLVIEEQNINKYPLMRKMFKYVTTDWAVWFDDDSYITEPGWMTKLVNLCANARVAVGGKEYSWPLLEGQLSWIQEASWFRGVAPMEHNRELKIKFITGGFQILDVHKMRELDWPDARLDHNGGDVMLGEACHQLGFNIGNLSLEQHGIVVSGAKRRGTAQRSAGARSMRRQTFSPHVFYLTAERLIEMANSSVLGMLFNLKPEDTKKAMLTISSMDAATASLNKAGGCKSCDRRKSLKKLEAGRNELISLARPYILSLDENQKNTLMNYIKESYNRSVKVVYYSSIGQILGE